MYPRTTEFVKPNVNNISVCLINPKTIHYRCSMNTRFRKDMTFHCKACRVINQFVYEYKFYVYMIGEYIMTRFNLSAIFLLLHLYLSF